MINSIFIPIIIIFLGYYIKIKPSKKIGGCGYDTITSRKSQEIWDYAQSVAPKYVLRVGYTFLVINLLSYLILPTMFACDSLIISLTPVISAFICLIIMFCLVERDIKKDLVANLNKAVLDFVKCKFRCSIQ